MGSELTSDLLPRLMPQLYRSDFLAFADMSFRTLNPGTDLITGEHLMAIRNALSLVELGKVRRLLVTMPPRHLKSHLISVAWPAWLLGHDPRKQIITVSYGLDLSHGFSAASRRIMASEWYRGAFPNTLDPKSNARDEIRTRKMGGRFATSVGGALTGRGADILILDDPMSADEAFSSASRDRVWEWFGGALMSRLNDPKTGAIVVVAQRLHIQDLPGRLLAAGGWTHLNLPAVAFKKQIIKVGGPYTWSRQPGELLHPARIGPKEIEQLQRELSPEVWEAQYQQRPSPPGGSIFKLAEFRRYENKTFKRSFFEAIIVSIDTGLSTSQKADFTAATVWGIHGERSYLLDAERGRFSFNEQIDLVDRLTNLYKPERVLIEQAASGHLLIEELRRSGRRNILSYNPRDDKISRAHASTAKIRAGLIYIPADGRQWLEPLTAEVAAFPNGKNDDWVDSMTQYIRALDLGFAGLDLSVYGKRADVKVYVSGESYG